MSYVRKKSYADNTLATLILEGDREGDTGIQRLPGDRVTTTWPTPSSPADAKRQAQRRDEASRHLSTVYRYYLRKSARSQTGYQRRRVPGT
eukprot:scaffold158038_cov30-Tisochrysis_lutea.AAC.1